MARSHGEEEFAAEFEVREDAHFLGALLGWTDLGVPQGLYYVRSEDVLYMCDGNNSRIIKVICTQDFGRAGSFGKVPGKIDTPHYIAVDSTEPSMRRTSATGARQVCEEVEDYLRECPQLDVRYHSACIRSSRRGSFTWTVIGASQAVTRVARSHGRSFESVCVSRRAAKKKLASGSRSNSGVCNGDDRRRPREDPPPARLTGMKSEVPIQKRRDAARGAFFWDVGDPGT